MRKRSAIYLSLAISSITIASLFASEDQSYFRMGWGSYFSHSLPPDTPIELNITNTPPSRVEASRHFLFTPQASGGDGHYRWSFSTEDDNFPFTFDSSTGSVSGSTPWAGNFSFNLTVQDNSGERFSKTFSTEVSSSPSPENAPIITSPYDPNAEEKLTGIGDNDYLELSPGEYFEIDFGKPTVVDSIAFDTILSGYCSGVGTYYLKAYAIDDAGNAKQVDRYLTNNLNCADSANPSQPNNWTVKTTTRYIIPTGWELLAECPSAEKYTPIYKSLHWPINRQIHTQTYQGIVCLSGQAISPYSDEEINRRGAFGIWGAHFFISGTPVRMAHIRSWVRNSTVSYSSITTPAVDAVNFSGGNYSKLRFVVAESYNNNSVLLKNINILTTPTVKSDLPDNFSSRIPASVDIPISKSGGKGTYIVECKNLPPGLTCNVNRITGTPTTPGNYTSSIRVLDGSNPNNVSSKSISFTIHPRLSISTPSHYEIPNSGTISIKLSVSGIVGSATYTLSPTSSPLPPGFTLSPDGNISGTISGPGGWPNIRVTVSDSNQTVTSSPFSIVSPNPQGPSNLTPYGVHRYWGIEMYAANYDVFSLTALEMRSDPDGDDLTVGGSAHLTSTHNNEIADYAFDRNSNTWATSASVNYPQRIWYDFKKNVAINHVTLMSNSFARAAPTDFAIIHSDDGINWSYGWRPEKSAAWTGNLKRTYVSPEYKSYIATPPAGAHRYWGIRPTSGGAHSVYTFGEVQFRSSVGGEHLSLKGSAVPTTHYSGMPPIFAFDNNLNTTYSDYISNNPILIFDFRENFPVSVKEVAIYPRANLLAQTPTGWDVVYSDDGINWTIAWSNTTTSWTAGWRTFSAPP